MKKIQCFAFLLAVLILSSCSPKLQLDETSCHINMGLRVSIDVTDEKPRVVFDQLARKLGCDISVSPFIWKHVTLQLGNAAVSEVLDRVCSQIGCKYILNGDHLAIKPLTIFDRLKAQQWERFNEYMEQRNSKLRSQLPAGMSFTNVPLSTVLEEISKASGLNIRPWQDEGDRKVTIDVSGTTVAEAIQAVLVYVDGEGAVLIEQKYFLHYSWGQYWAGDYPPGQ